MLNRKKYLISAVVVIILQLVIADLLTVRLVRPDFILIYILYISVWEGRLWGIIVGFVLGLFMDFVGVATYFGLSSLSYSIFAYLAGYLHGRYSKWPPIGFHLYGAGVIVIHFLFQLLITSQHILTSNPQVFWARVFFTAVYSLSFVIITNLFLPLGTED
ncbi:MAG: rod shape-determining protein MreD [Candidatus Marinimicrobia bacterium]|nr:rod shape-determining protein MreD [Candidatus Neomarinimicrobiota bacterium]